MNVKKWTIFRANLDPTQGSEQGKTRPVLVISEDEINELLNVVNIIPITSRKVGRKVYPNESLILSNNFGLEKESIVLCHQIRTIDKQRLAKVYVEINDKKVQSEIVEALCFQLGINRE
jgi:mRNA interferase MazF